MMDHGRNLTKLAIKCQMIVHYCTIAGAEWNLWDIELQLQLHPESYWKTRVPSQYDLYLTPLESTNFH